MAARSYANMRAFIVTPFGEKKDAQGNLIDFDQVRETLIEPALDQLGIGGRTTGEIVRAGSIHADMFQRLLTADLVVAEISIHNANVFYELGIRHALRQHRTFMLRGEWNKKNKKSDPPPFDIQGLRYLKYDRRDPAASLGALVEGLRETLDRPDRDSPVFRNLPALKEQARSNFIPVPREFADEVTLAERARHVGDLALLALETRGFEWWAGGLRLVGNAQFRLKDFAGARQTWEEIRKVYPDDKEANTWLGTVYQRLAEKARGRAEADDLFARSDQALNFVAGHPEATAREKAEAFALQGRNAKTRWVADWRNHPAEERRAQALRSRYLQDAYEAYAKGFNEDLNHFYPGLNALAMVSVRIGLADAMRKVWAEGFETKAKATVELDELIERRDELGPSVGLSINAELNRLARETPETNPDLLWAKISYADHCFLTSGKPERVKNEYNKSLAGVPPFASDSAARQIMLYKELGLFPENVAAALEGINATPEPEKRPEEQPRVILFTGHRVDDRKRKKKRFPPSKAGVAKAAIKRAVKRELEEAGGNAVGIAGGASGGDILFHEVCEELGVPTYLYLALPRQDYVRASVQPSGDDWVKRFDDLYKRNQNKREMAWSEELPAWLREKQEKYSIWQRNNLWTLSNALALDAAGGGANVVLIALWDKETKGDGPGGTQDMVTQAEARGARKRILYTKKLFGLADADAPRRPGPARRARKR